LAKLLSLVIVGFDATPEESHCPSHYHDKHDYQGFGISALTRYLFKHADTSHGYDAAKIIMNNRILARAYNELKSFRWSICKTTNKYRSSPIMIRKIMFETAIFCKSKRTRNNESNIPSIK
jgi:hypothetical protein